MKKLYAPYAASAITMAVLLTLSSACHAEHDAANTAPANATPAHPAADHQLQAHQIHKEKQDQLEKEAVEAVMETENALTALNNGKAKEALLDLEVAAAKLRVLLAKNAEMKFVPVSFQEEAYLFDGSLDDVKAASKKATQLITEHRIQDARQILNELASEVRINIVNLPLVEYPAAIEKSAALIVAGKEDEAKKTLRQTLDTLTSNVEIYPLPVLAAEADLSEAYELEHKADLSKQESKDHILALADKAESQLKLAEALGYGDKTDYSELYQGIQALRDTLHTNKYKAAWKKLKGALGQLKNKVLHHVK